MILMPIVLPLNRGFSDRFPVPILDAWWTQKYARKQDFMGLSLILLVPDWPMALRRSRVQFPLSPPVQKTAWSGLFCFQGRLSLVIEPFSLSFSFFDVSLAVWGVQRCLDSEVRPKVRPLLYDLWKLVPMAKSRIPVFSSILSFICSNILDRDGSNTDDWPRKAF